MRFDYVVVGAGLCGCVIAERIATQLRKSVLIVERRDHVGGNCHDYFDEAGVLVHKYGPHYFRTNDVEVWNYLSRFTDWHYVQYRIKASVDGQLLTLPINLDTFNTLYGTNLSSDQLKEVFISRGGSVSAIRNSKDAIVSKVGEELYEKFYKHYTEKQWAVGPEELDASVCERIPVRTNRDDRYFTDKYQAMPKHGYFRMFSKMLEDPNIRLLLRTELDLVKDSLQYEKLIYTGPIDAYFGYKHGKLPYRSLRFEHETLDVEFHQPVSQVNYPNEYDFTRIVEIKHATGQKHPKTTIVREYPLPEGEPYYPVPAPANHSIYERYRKDADTLSNVIFLGRLAEYRYYNMDQAVRRALDIFKSELA